MVGSSDEMTALCSAGEMIGQNLDGYAPMTELGELYNTFIFVWKVLVSVGMQNVSQTCCCVQVPRLLLQISLAELGARYRRVSHGSLAGCFRIVPFRGSQHSLSKANWFVSVRRLQTVFLVGGLGFG